MSAAPETKAQRSVTGPTIAGLALQGGALPPTGERLGPYGPAGRVEPWLLLVPTNWPLALERRPRTRGARDILALPRLAIPASVMYASIIFLVE